jgi:hypothetical protein
VRETLAGAIEAFTALTESAPRGGAFITFQLSVPLAAKRVETAPPLTVNIPFVKLIGSLPRISSGCTGTRPSNPVLDRRKTPVTGRNGANPLNPNPPKPKPGDHNHPNPGSKIQPP